MIFLGLIGKSEKLFKTKEMVRIYKDLLWVIMFTWSTLYIDQIIDMDMFTENRASSTNNKIKRKADFGILLKILLVHW